MAGGIYYRVFCYGTCHTKELIHTSNQTQTIFLQLLMWQVVIRTISFSHWLVIDTTVICTNVNYTVVNFFFLVIFHSPYHWGPTNFRWLFQWLINFHFWHRWSRKNKELQWPGGCIKARTTCPTSVAAPRWLSRPSHVTSYWRLHTQKPWHNCHPQYLLSLCNFQWPIHHSCNWWGKCKLNEILICTCSSVRYLFILLLIVLLISIMRFIFIVCAWKCRSGMCSIMIKLHRLCGQQIVNRQQQEPWLRRLLPHGKGDTLVQK